MEKLSRYFDQALCFVGILVGAMLLDHNFDRVMIEYVTFIIGTVMVLGFHHMFITNKYLWSGD